jgi:hypothetical protein
MLAPQGHDLCIIGLDITALIDCALWCTARPWHSWTDCLVLQTIQVFARPGVRYQSVLELARAPGDLDIKGVCRVGRPFEARLDSRH